MRIQGIAATTTPIKRGGEYVKISVEALENVSAIGVPVSYGHNPLLLPLGKVERTWVEKPSPTEASLHQCTYFATDAPELFTHKTSRMPCAHIPFADSPGKFTVNTSHQKPGVMVDVSAVPPKNHKQLEQEIRNYNERIILSSHDRREEVPTPLITFVLDKSLVEIFWIGIKVYIFKQTVTGGLSRWVKAMAKWVRDECVPMVKAYRQHKTKESTSKVKEWIVWEIDASDADGPLIELVIASSHDAEVPESSAEKFAEQIELFRDLLPNCDKIVFAFYPDEDKCEFRYALTKNGGVMGSEACYEESIRLHNQWIAMKKEGTAVWWMLVTKDDGTLAMQLFHLGGDRPKFLGYASMNSNVASALLEVVDADDGILRPLTITDTEASSDLDPQGGATD